MSVIFVAALARHDARFERQAIADVRASGGDNDLNLQRLPPASTTTVSQRRRPTTDMHHGDIVTVADGRAEGADRGDRADVVFDRRAIEHRRLP